MSRRDSESLDLEQHDTGQQHLFGKSEVDHERFRDPSGSRLGRFASAHGLNLWQYALFLVPWFFLPIAYRLGFVRGVVKALPPLPLDVALGDAFELRISQLDDNFDVRLPENEKFKGQPRPELDEAWNGLLKYMNVRIHPDEARAADFESVEILDGSQDVFGSPVVFHNLHCLLMIRRFLTPDVYMAQGPHLLNYAEEVPGAIPEHIDHCIDNLRQAIMCHGDMAMYRLQWREEVPLPRPIGLMPHRCINWDKMMDWAEQRSFDFYQYGLKPDEKFANYSMPYTLINYSAAVQLPYHR